MNAKFSGVVATIVSFSFIGLTACQQDDNKKVASNPFMHNAEQQQESVAVQPVATAASNPSTVATETSSTAFAPSTVGEESQSATEVQAPNSKDVSGNASTVEESATNSTSTEVGSNESSVVTGSSTSSPLPAENGTNQQSTVEQSSVVASSTELSTEDANSEKEKNKESNVSVKSST